MSPGKGQYEVKYLLQFLAVTGQDHDFKKDCGDHNILEILKLMLEDRKVLNMILNRYIFLPESCIKIR